jgi:hypothetical protein
MRNKMALASILAASMCIAVPAMAKHKGYEDMNEPA